MELVQIAPALKAPAPKPTGSRPAPVGENYHSSSNSPARSSSTPSAKAPLPNIGECCTTNRNLHDAGQPLHPPLRILRRSQSRPSLSISTSRAAWLRPSPRSASSTPSSPALTATTTSSAARAPSPGHRRNSPPGPGCRIEVLIPIFRAIRKPSARSSKLTRGAQSQHRVRPRLYRVVRSGARYELPLSYCATPKSCGRGLTKSGVMVGLGEETAELLQVFRDLAAVHCDILTIGQYLRPPRSPTMAASTRRESCRVESRSPQNGLPSRRIRPLVRSSYTLTSKPRQLGCLS